MSGHAFFFALLVLSALLNFLGWERYLFASAAAAEADGWPSTGVLEAPPPVTEPGLRADPSAFSSRGQGDGQGGDGEPRTSENTPFDSKAFAQEHSHLGAKPKYWKHLKKKYMKSKGKKWAKIQRDTELALAGGRGIHVKKQHSAIQCPVPAGRWLHTATYVGGSVFIFGGVDATAVRAANRALRGAIHGEAVKEQPAAAAAAGAPSFLEMDSEFLEEQLEEADAEVLADEDRDFSGLGFPRFVALTATSASSAGADESASSSAGDDNKKNKNKSKKGKKRKGKKKGSGSSKDLLPPPRKETAAAESSLMNDIWSYNLQAGYWRELQPDLVPCPHKELLATTKNKLLEQLPYYRPGSVPAPPSVRLSPGETDEDSSISGNGGFGLFDKNVYGDEGSRDATSTMTAEDLFAMLSGEAASSSSSSSSPVLPVTDGRVGFSNNPADIQAETSDNYPSTTTKLIIPKPASFLELDENEEEEEAEEEEEPLFDSEDDEDQQQQQQQRQRAEEAHRHTAYLKKGARRAAKEAVRRAGLYAEVLGLHGHADALLQSHATTTAATTTAATATTTGGADSKHAQLMASLPHFIIEELEEEGGGETEADAKGGGEEEGAVKEDEEAQKEEDSAATAAVFLELDSAFKSLGKLRLSSASDRSGGETGADGAHEDGLLVSQSSSSSSSSSLRHRHNSRKEKEKKKQQKRMLKRLYRHHPYLRYLSPRYRLNKKTAKEEEQEDLVPVAHRMGTVPKGIAKAIRKHSQRVVDEFGQERWLYHGISQAATPEDAAKQLAALGPLGLAPILGSSKDAADFGSLSLEDQMGMPSAVLTFLSRRRVVYTPADALWQYDLASRKWMQPASDPRPYVDVPVSLVQEGIAKALPQEPMVGDFAANPLPDPHTQDLSGKPPKPGAGMTNSKTPPKSKFAQVDEGMAKGGEEGKEEKVADKEKEKEKAAAPAPVPAPAPAAALLEIGEGEQGEKAETGVAAASASEQGQRLPEATSIPRDQLFLGKSPLDKTGIGGYGRYGRLQYSLNPDLQYPALHPAPRPLSAPAPRWLHTAVAMARGVVVFGGVSSHDLRVMGDVWHFDPESPMPIEQDQYPDDASRANAEYANFPSGKVWRKLWPPPLPTPSASPAASADSTRSMTNPIGMSSTGRLTSAFAGVSTPEVYDPLGPYSPFKPPITTVVKKGKGANTKQGNPITAGYKLTIPLAPLPLEGHTAVVVRTAGSTPPASRNLPQSLKDLYVTMAPSTSAITLKAESKGTGPAQTNGNGAPGTSADGAKEVMLVFGGLVAGTLAEASPFDPTAAYVSSILSSAANTEGLVWAFQLKARPEWRAHFPAASPSPVPASVGTGTKSIATVPRNRWLHSASVVRLPKTAGKTAAKVSKTGQGGNSGSEDMMVVFGGCDTRTMKPLNDVWVYRLSDNTWRELIPHGYGPSPRWLASMVAIRPPPLMPASIAGPSDPTPEGAIYTSPDFGGGDDEDPKFRDKSMTAEQNDEDAHADARFKQQKAEGKADAAGAAEAGSGSGGVLGFINKLVGKAAAMISDRYATKIFQARDAANAMRHRAELEGKLKAWDPTKYRDGLEPLPLEARPTPPTAILRDEVEAIDNVYEKLVDKEPKPLQGGVWNGGETEHFIKMRRKMGLDMDSFTEDQKRALEIFSRRGPPMPSPSSSPVAFANQFFKVSPSPGAPRTATPTPPLANRYPPPPMGHAPVAVQPALYGFLEVDSESKSEAGLDPESASAFGFSDMDAGLAAEEEGGFAFAAKHLAGARAPPSRMSHDADRAAIVRELEEDPRINRNSALAKAEEDLAEMRFSASTAGAGAGSGAGKKKGKKGKSGGGSSSPSNPHTRAAVKAAIEALAGADLADDDTGSSSSSSSSKTTKKAPPPKQQKPGSTSSSSSSNPLVPQPLDPYDVNPEAASDLAKEVKALYRAAPPQYGDQPDIAYGIDYVPGSGPARSTKGIGEAPTGAALYVFGGASDTGSTYDDHFVLHIIPSSSLLIDSGKDAKTTWVAVWDAMIDVNSGPIAREGAAAVVVTSIPEQSGIDKYAAWVSAQTDAVLGQAESRKEGPPPAPPSSSSSSSSKLRGGGGSGGSGTSRFAQIDQRQGGELTPEEKAAQGSVNDELELVRVKDSKKDSAPADPRRALAIPPDQAYTLAINPPPYAQWVLVFGGAQRSFPVVLDTKPQVLAAPLGALLNAAAEEIKDEEIAMSISDNGDAKPAKKGLK